MLEEILKKLSKNKTSARWIPDHIFERDSGISGNWRNPIKKLRRPKETAITVSRKKCMRIPNRIAERIPKINDGVVSLKNAREISEKKNA